MRVALISYTPNPELTIAAAARLSASSVNATRLMEEIGRVDSLLRRLISSGHLSPL